MPDKTILLATDLQQSVLIAVKTSQPHPVVHTPYGHRPKGSSLFSQIGFNGQMPDPVTGHYHLGNGYRQYNPVLMRFNSPDSWSPFGKGGLNAYAYCAGEPINRTDSSGHSFLGIGRGRSDRNFLKTTLKYLNERVVSIGGRQGVDPLTENSLKATMQQLGGAKEIKEAARRINMEPQNYLTLHMPEMQFQNPPSIPTQAALQQLTRQARNDLLLAAVGRISRMENHQTVLADLIDGSRPKIVLRAMEVSAHKQKLIINDRLLVNTIVPNSYRHDPPPSYREVTTIRMSN